MTSTFDSDRETGPEKRSVLRAMLRGAANRCPSCGDGGILSGFLTVNRECSSCGEELHHHRADDAPPYFTIFIVGHIVIPGVLIVERLYQPPILWQLAVWLPLTLVLAFLFMRPIKGALIGLQWANYMHGFDPESPERDIEPEPGPARP